MRIAYDKNIPREVRAQLQEMIDPLARRYAPGWCNSLTVMWDSPCDSGDVQNTYAECQPRYDYRAASIIVYPAFLRVAKAERKAIIVHELCHLLNAPLLQFLQSTIGILCPDPSDPMRAILAENGRVAVEASVEDTTNVILGRA